MNNPSINPQQFVDATGRYIPQGNGVEVSVDTNGDRVIDSVVHTSMEGRTVEVLDSDFDGRFDLVVDSTSAYDHTVTAYLDSYGDGTMDVMLQDADTDGVWDTVMSDQDIDGVYETPGYDPIG